MASSMRLMLLKGQRAQSTGGDRCKKDSVGGRIAVRARAGVRQGS
jgi:hypothetical protein